MGKCPLKLFSFWLFALFCLLKLFNVLVKVTKIPMMSLMLTTSYSATVRNLHSNKARLLEDIEYGHKEQIQTSTGAVKRSPLKLSVLV